MAKERDQETSSEAEDDRAAGHVVRSLLKGRQGLLIIALTVGFGGREGYRAFFESASTDRGTTRLERKVDSVAANVLDVKITVKAMLETTPKAQRQAAEKLIHDRLEVLNEARKQTAMAQKGDQ